MSDRPAVRPVPPPSRASARKGAYARDGTNNGTSTQRDSHLRPVTGRTPGQSRKDTLGGSNRMLSARDVAAILAVPESTVRSRWREWGLPAYLVGKHLRWRERDVLAWIDRQNA